MDSPSSNNSPQDRYRRFLSVTSFGVVKLTKCANCFRSALWQQLFGEQAYLVVCCTVLNEPFRGWALAQGVPPARQFPGRP